MHLQRLAGAVLAFTLSVEADDQRDDTDQADAEWQTVELVDEFDVPVGTSRAYARATFADGVHWCLLHIDHIDVGQSWRDGFFPVRGQAGLSCDYSPFGSGDARARIADRAPVTVGFTPHDNGGRFGNYTVEGDTYETGGVHSRQRDYYHAFADELFESMHDAGAIRISLPAKPGDVLLTFPLKGLADALEDAGFDTRRYTQYESTWHFGGGSVAKNVFWLHESDLAELANLRRDTLKVRVTFAVRSADGSTRPGD